MVFPNNLAMGRIIAATPKILPAVYDDALTYVEQLRVLNCKLNEVIDEFNSYGDELLINSKKYTDEQIKILNDKMTVTLQEFKEQIDNGLADLDATLTDKLDEFDERAEAEFAWFRQRADELFEMFVEETTKLNENINRLQIAVNTLFDALSRTKLEMRKEIQAEIEKIVKWLEQALAAKTGDQIIVKNPVTMILTSLNVALESLANVSKLMFSLTVDEYNSLQLTVDEYAAYQITASDYIYKGRWIFFHELYFPDLDMRFDEVYGYINKEVEALVKNHYMVSPFDGVVTPIANVVYDLATLHMNPITADQYNELLLTVDVYNEKQITAHDYLWNGYFILYTGAVPKPTLQEQIQELQNALAESVQRIQNLENGSTESPSISEMKREIAQQRADFNRQIETQKSTDDAQDNGITINARAIQKNADDIKNVLTVTIPDEIEGLQTQISEINSGLESINIRWKVMSSFTNRKKGV